MEIAAILVGLLLESVIPGYIYLTFKNEIISLFGYNLTNNKTEALVIFGDFLTHIHHSIRVHNILVHIIIYRQDKQSLQ